MRLAQGRRGCKRYDSIHRVNNLEIDLDKIPYLLITGNGKCLPGIVHGAIIIVPVGR